MPLHLLELLALPVLFLLTTVSQHLFSLCKVSVRVRVRVRVRVGVGVRARARARAS